MSARDVIADLRALAARTSDAHADLPGPGEDLRILDRHLVLNGVGIAHRVALDEAQRITVEVARHAVWFDGGLRVSPSTSTGKWIGN